MRDEVTEWVGEGGPGLSSTAVERLSAEMLCA